MRRIFPKIGFEFTRWCWTPDNSKTQSNFFLFGSTKTIKCVLPVCLYIEKHRPSMSHTGICARDNLSHFFGLEFPICFSFRLSQSFSALPFAERKKSFFLMSLRNVWRTLRRLSKLNYFRWKRQSDFREFLSQWNTVASRDKTTFFVVEIYALLLQTARPNF